MLFLAVPWVCLPLLIVVIPGHTHLLFLRQREMNVVGFFFKMKKKTQVKNRCNVTRNLVTIELPLVLQYCKLGNFARVLLSRNFAYANFRENKILAKW